MRMQGNTIFITGGSSGIGRGLEEVFHQRGNQVIIAGRREDRLREVSARNSGMAYLVLDVTDPVEIRAVARQVIEKFPTVNCVFNNAGVQMRARISEDGALDEQSLQTEITTNLLAPIRVAAFFLPHLANRNGTLVNVSSGLAFVPMARFPVYCATKAAIHSWTMTLRYDWQKRGVKVIELIPPYVGTELGGAGKPASNPGQGPMPLDAFLVETMKELEADGDEVAIADAKRLVAATSPDIVKKTFGFINE